MAEPELDGEPTASALVRACEDAWADIQSHHPELPPVVIVTSLVDAELPDGMFASTKVSTRSRPLSGAMSSIVNVLEAFVSCPISLSVFMS